VKPPKEVKDLMVPIEDYATVPQDATLYEAVIALEETQMRSHHHQYPHRAVLVLDEGSKVVGKLSQWDLIKALEPGYGEITDSKSLSRFGFSPNFIRSMVKSRGLWQKPLDNLAEKAARIKVRSVMYTPAEGEFVDADASLDEGIHQLIMGHHQSLLVTSGSRVVGVLRLIDVFFVICNMIKSSKD
jgi:CBS domain-containing protein